MPWTVSPDVRELAREAFGFLESDPLTHTQLLTEVAYLLGRPDAAEQPGGRYGWWRRDADGLAEGAFLQAPRHDPALSLMPAEAAAELVETVPDVLPLDADPRLSAALRDAWRRRHGGDLAEGGRVRLHELTGGLPPLPPDGTARPAGEADRDLVTAWYRRLLDETGDPSDLAYLVDDPLPRGGLTIWEADGAPRAVSGRSRTVAGTVRVSATYAPDGDEGAEEAVLVAACRAARDAGLRVLVYGPATDGPAADRLRRLGFEAVRERVRLVSA